MDLDNLGGIKPEPAQEVEGEKVNHKNLRWSPKNRETFLKIVSEGGSITLAAKAINFSRAGVYVVRERDEEFKKDWDAAVEEGTDLLEDEALRRALAGVQEPVGFFQGEHGGTFVKKYSDTLTIFILKARRPEKYKERSETEHKGGITIQMPKKDASTL
jgi:hypothetical protein